MYALIKTGGKQLQVREGEVYSVEKLPGESGSEAIFDEVLLLSKDGEVKLGTPLVDGAVVKGKIVSQCRDVKKIHRRYKNKTRSSSRRGHRQYITRVIITSVDGF